MSANKKVSAVDVLKKKKAKAKASASVPSVVLIRANEVDGKKHFVIVNLSDFDKRTKAHKALSSFEGTRITKKSLQTLSATAKELGLKVKPYKEAEASEAPEKAKRVPPKFEPRTFTLGDRTLVELHPNVRNFVDKLFLIRGEEEVTVSPKTGKKLKNPRKVTVEKLVVCVYVGNPTAWVVNLETEDAYPLLVDFLNERKIWEYDEDGNYDKTSEPIGELIPVAIKQEESPAKEEVEDEE